MPSFREGNRDPGLRDLPFLLRGTWGHPLPEPRGSPRLALPICRAPSSGRASSPSAMAVASTPVTRAVSQMRESIPRGLGNWPQLCIQEITCSQAPRALARNFYPWYEGHGPHPLKRGESVKHLLLLTAVTRLPRVDGQVGHCTSMAHEEAVPKSQALVACHAAIPDSSTSAQCRDSCPFLICTEVL